MAWALTLPSQCCAVKQTGRVLVLVPAGEHSACLQHRPAPRDGLPLLLNRPGQESQRSRASCIFLLALAPLRHMPGAATWYLESLYFSESHMKGRRALPTAQASTGQKKPRQRLAQLLSLSFNGLESPRSLARKDESTLVQKLLTSNSQQLTSTDQAAAVMVFA